VFTTDELSCRGCGTVSYCYLHLRGHLELGGVASARVLVQAAAPAAVPTGSISGSHFISSPGRRCSKNSLSSWLLQLRWRAQYYWRRERRCT